VIDQAPARRLGEGEREHHVQQIRVDQRRAADQQAPPRRRKPCGRAQVQVQRREHQPVRHQRVVPDRAIGQQWTQHEQRGDDEPRRDAAGRHPGKQPAEERLQQVADEHPQAEILEFVGQDGTHQLEQQREHGNRIGEDDRAPHFHAVIGRRTRRQMPVFQPEEVPAKELRCRIGQPEEPPEIGRVEQARVEQQEKHERTQQRGGQRRRGTADAHAKRRGVNWR
jgi:hypothetical protein